MQLYGLRMKCGTKLQDHLQQLDEQSDQLTFIDSYSHWRRSDRVTQGSCASTRELPDTSMYVMVLLTKGAKLD